MTGRRGRLAGMGTGDGIGLRARNRALLARQLLLERADMPAVAAVELLVGMQAQVPDPPYVGLWSRLAGFRFEELAEQVTARQVVRATLMRGTIHLVSARDMTALRPMVQPLLERGLRQNQQYGRERLAGVDLAALLAAGAEIVAEQPRTAAQLRDLLAPRWPDHDPAALAYAVRNLLPMVHVPPRGLWGQSGPIAMTTAAAWLGRDVDESARPGEIVWRYLAAFGPASVADAQTWSGLTGLRSVFEDLRPRLRTFRDEAGRELFDVPDGPRPDPDTPAPPRLVAPFDNLILSHADRRHVISDEYRKRISTKNGIFPGVITVDGFMAGTWRIDRQRDAATVVVAPFAALSQSDTSALVGEAAALLPLAAPSAISHDVTFAPPR